MEIKVKFHGDVQSLPITAKTTTSSVIGKLAKTYNIDAGTIKLIFKGKQLRKNSNTIVDEGVKSGDKLLLTVAEKPSKTAKGKRAAGKVDKRRIKPSDLILEDIPLPDVVKNGPPEGVVEGLSSQVAKLPKTPFVVYTKEGKVARLSVESDAIFIECEDGTVERLFDVIYNTKSNDIPGFEGSYISLYLKTSDGIRVYHYLPKQYQNVLKEYLTSLVKLN